MILSLLSFPLPPSALCTIFSERILPCPVTSACVSLPTCQVCSWLSMFALSWGLQGGGGTCCCGEGIGKGDGGRAGGRGVGGGEITPAHFLTSKSRILKARRAFNLNAGTPSPLWAYLLHIAQGVKSAV